MTEGPPCDGDRPIDPGALPDLHQATIDDAVLEVLLADITALCLVDEVVLRAPEPPTSGSSFVPAGDREPPAGEIADLATLHERFRTGEIAAARIRYRHDAESWIDTVTRVGSSYLLVRMRDPLRPDGTGPRTREA